LSSLVGIVINIARGLRLRETTFPIGVVGRKPDNIRENPAIRQPGENDHARVKV
jgi:hypothetical protein